MLALLQGLPRTQKYPFPASKVTLVDATGPSVTGTLDAGGWDQVERDADRLYLVVLGKPDKNPQKDRERHRRRDLARRSPCRARGTSAEGLPEAA